MYVALCFYLQATIVHVLMLIDIFRIASGFLLCKEKIWSTNKTSA